MKARTDNERFGASGGVAPQKVQCEFASECPATTVVSPPPSPSRRTLCDTRRKRHRNLKKRKKQLNILYNQSENFVENFFKNQSNNME
jgi:hypothetical protein